MYSINYGTNHRINISISSIQYNYKYKMFPLQVQKQQQIIVNKNSSFHVYNCLNQKNNQDEIMRFKNCLLSRVNTKITYQNQQLNNQVQSSLQSFNQEIEVKIQEETQNTSKNSVFHNFLKHLITTLKQNITIEIIQKYASQMEYDSQLPTRIWKQFIKSRNFTKKMLLMIVGSTNNNYKIQNKINKFLNTSKYSRAQVNRSQELLRKIVIEKFDDASLEQALKNRNFQSLEYFTIYFKNFIQELTSKCVNKRLTKQKRLKILRPQVLEK